MADKIILIVAYIIVIILAPTWLLCVLWNVVRWNPKFLVPICDGLFKWHIPQEKETFDGCSFHSKCKFCGKEIMQDGQGNWY